MINHETHDEEDFDSIIGDDEGRTILTGLNLLPSSWGLPFGEQKRILGSGLMLNVTTELPERNWPACADCTGNNVRIARDFLESELFTRDEKLATIIHDVGHIVNPEPAEEHWTEKPEVERTDGYLEAMAPNEAPVAVTELYADDYARHCGLRAELQSALKNLKLVSHRFCSTSTGERIRRIEDAEPLRLNLRPLQATV
jgi:hypothetical protein